MPVQNDPLRTSILIIAPLSWSIRKIASEFDTSSRIAEHGKKIRESQGVLAEPLARKGKPLTAEMV